MKQKKIYALIVLMFLASILYPPSLICEESASQPLPKEQSLISWLKKSTIKAYDWAKQKESFKKIVRLAGSVFHELDPAFKIPADMIASDEGRQGIKDISFQPVPLSEDQVVIHLKNKNSISCLILSETSHSIRVLWREGHITLEKNEIDLIERKSVITEGDGILIDEANNTWVNYPYKNSPVIRMVNGEVWDGEIIKVRSEALLFRNQLGDGAFVEFEIPRSKIAYLEFKPVQNQSSQLVEDNLRKVFPKMRFYREGMAVLITDTAGPSLKLLKQTLRDQITYLYLSFYPLFLKRHPACSAFVVVFDKWEDYMTYAIGDGVPAWMASGYYDPKSKTLYTANLVGDSQTDLYYQIVLSGKQFLNAFKDRIVSRYGEEYRTQINGLAEDQKKLFDTWMSYITDIFRKQTVSTLRHEITHQFFSVWGIQAFVVSKIDPDNPELIRKKKELMEAKDLEKKKKILMEIRGLDKEGKSSDDKLRIQAANSCFCEGLAEYASSTGLGLENVDMQFILKDWKKKNEIWPIEHLSVHKVGSFAGVSDHAILSAYAQSWSLVDFLMKNHRNSFIAYLKKMSWKKPTGKEDYLWLVKTIKKDPKTLEKEWIQSIDSMKEVEDPRVEEWFKLRKIFHCKT